MAYRRFLAILFAASMGTGGLLSASAADQATTVPVVSIGSVSMLEGNAGARVVVFPVTLSAPSASTVSVHYATASGTATSGSDFTGASGTLSFSAGTTTSFVPVTIESDTTIEPSELFTVKLSSPTGATLGQATGYGVINNDDPSVTVSIDNVSVAEGDVGSRKLGFVVTLSAPSTSTVSVHYATGPGTATTGSDFTAASGDVTFTPGATTRFVPVFVRGDTSFEPSETIMVKLSSPVGALIAQGTGVGTIVNDDPGTCGIPSPAPTRYSSVVVFAFENRTWSTVGGLGFGTGMPYLHGLAQRCAYFSDWTETDTTQNSLTQYVGQVTGARQPGTVNDCQPSATCSTTANNIFRQARNRSLNAVNYVEGATTGCSNGGNPLRSFTIPDLYLWGADDRSHCSGQVRPLSEFDPNQLPSFALITPTLCDNGHDCSNAVVDAWAQAHVQPVLDSNAYKAGKVAVFIWYDEDHPVPNLWITPTAHSGSLATAGAGYSDTLKAWESMLGLPCLANACTAPDMRTPANS